jgi:hypothetical protein
MQMLPLTDIHKIEKFIKNPQSLRTRGAPYIAESDLITKFDSVRNAESGAFCFYSSEGFNEYAFYKSRDDSIYSITFYATRLSSYYKY